MRSLFSKKQCSKTPQEEEQMKVVSYASAIQSLIYVMLCIKPDICFAVGMIIKYQSNLGPLHLVVRNFMYAMLCTKIFAL